MGETIVVRTETITKNYELGYVPSNCPYCNGTFIYNTDTELWRCRMCGANETLKFEPVVPITRDIIDIKNDSRSVSRMKEFTCIRCGKNSYRDRTSSLDVCKSCIQYIWYAERKKDVQRYGNFLVFKNRRDITCDVCGEDILRREYYCKDNVGAKKHIRCLTDDEEIRKAEEQLSTIEEKKKIKDQKYVNLSLCS